MTAKQTSRMKRDADIKALEDASEDALQKLLQNIDHKHQNGGIFDDLDHHTKCIKTLTEEEMNNG